MPSQAFYNAFADPRTGEYNVAAVQPVPLARPRANRAGRSRLGRSSTSRPVMEREVAEVPRPDQGRRVCQFARSGQRCELRQQHLCAGKWAGKKYSAVPDSLIQSVKSSDIKAYYNSHKNMFKQSAVACAFVCRVRGFSDRRRHAGARKERRRGRRASSPPPKS